LPPLTAFPSYAAADTHRDALDEMNPHADSFGSPTSRSRLSSFADPRFGLR
jgi:hypothetical protein